MGKAGLGKTASAAAMLGSSLLSGLMSGCAHYAPLPLARGASLAPSVNALAGVSAFAPATRLGIGQVVALALANNPELKAARLRRGVAAAQRAQAALLPNPTLGGAFLPLLSGVGSVPAWNIGVTQNVRAFVTYRSRRRAATDTVGQVDAEIVWQEWQVAGQARQLAADLILGARSRPVFARYYALLQDRNAKLERALAAGDVTLVTVAPDRVALQAARTSLDTLDQRQTVLMHQLDALLGLAPEVAVPLADMLDLPRFDPAAIRAALPRLPDRRPDLLALRLGYAATEESVRQAIASQFPDLVLGASASSDSSRVINVGPTASLGLPVFDRNQGNIAIARTTRAQLRADYDARLTGATGQVGALLGEIAQVSAQLAILRRDLPAARVAADRAAAAFGASNLDERGFVELVANRFTKEQEIMALELALIDRQIAVQTLTGDGLPEAPPLADAAGTQR